MKRILLFLFTLLSISQARASDTLTIRQVFNFNVGDTFDYREITFNQCVNFFAESYLRKIVIQKSYSANQDTIYYQYDLPYGTNSWPFSGNQFFKVTQFDTITNLDSFAIYLTEPLLLPSYPAGCTSAEYDTTTYCDYRSDSVTIGCFESADFFRYTNHLGITYFGMIGGGDPCGGNGTSYELIHFANDSMHCGYDILDGVTDISRTSKTYLYPNPSTEQVHLSYTGAGSTNTKFIIVDILGQLMYQSSVSQSESTHDISGLTAGIYTWRLVTDGMTIKTGKVVKQ